MNSEYEPEYDDVFGELIHDPPMEGWHASVELSVSERVEVAIWWSEQRDGPFTPVLQRARTAFQRFLRQEGSHKTLLAAAMLERYQDRGGMNQSLPALAEIIQNLTARQVWIASDGSLSVHYRDFSDLFGAHSITADIATDGSFAGFSLQG